MCIVVGAIIGVGIFFTPGGVARAAGSAELTMLAWAIGGVIALCGALTFAELGVRFPDAGGQYVVLREAFGAFPAFLFVFCNASAVQAGAIAAIALAGVNYVGVAFGAGDISPRVAIGCAALLIAGLAGANALGARSGAAIQVLTVAAKLLTLLAVVLIAVFAERRVIAADAPTSAATIGGAWLLPAAVVPTLFAYGGWQHALWMAGEVRDPRRTLPLAIVGGVVIVVAAYLAVNWAYLSLLGHSAVAAGTTVAADAVGRALPPVYQRVIAGAVALSAIGVLNAQLLSGPRLIYRLATDGLLPRVLAGVDRRTGAPTPAIALLAAFGLVVLLAGGDLGRLLNWTVFVDTVFFLLTGVALFVFRARGGGEALRIGFPVVPALFVLGECGVLVGTFLDPSGRAAAISGAAWIAVAAVLYFVFARPRGAP